MDLLPDVVRLSFWPRRVISCKTIHMFGTFAPLFAVAHRKGEFIARWVEMISQNLHITCSHMRACIQTSSIFEAHLAAQAARYRFKLTICHTRTHPHTIVYNHVGPCTVVQSLCDRDIPIHIPPARRQQIPIKSELGRFNET